MRTYTTVYFDVAINDTVKTVDFPHIEGRILGFSTTVVGTRPAERVQVVIKEGASDLHRPMDVNFSETTGRSSFEDGAIRLNVENPAAMSAQLTIPAGASGAFGVEVLIISENRYCD